MTALLRYLAGWLATMMWQRLRGRSPLPPTRLPVKSPSPLSAVSPWQALVGVWLLHKLWTQFGQQAKPQAPQGAKQRVKHQVKHRVKNAGRSASQRFDTWLYAPSRTAPAPSSAAQTATPAAPTNATPAGVNAPAATTPPHETQRLSDTLYA